MTLELISSIVLSLEIGQILSTIYKRWKTCPRNCSETWHNRNKGNRWGVHSL